jgi:ActR/RegA family two-component response regulator
MPVTVRMPIPVPEAARARTVLLVSADADWREAVERALASGGYHVLSARHSGQALVESTRYASLDLVVTEGEFGSRGTSLPPRIFADHPNAKTLHVKKRPRTREELLETIGAALK